MAEEKFSNFSGIVVITSIWHTKLYKITLNLFLSSLSVPHDYIKIDFILKKQFLVSIVVWCPMNVATQHNCNSIIHLHFLYFQNCEQGYFLNTL